MGVPSHSQLGVKYKARAAFTLFADERGVTAIEYTLLAALIVMSLVALISRSGTSSARLSKQSRPSSNFNGAS